MVQMDSAQRPQPETEVVKPGLTAFSPIRRFLRVVSLALTQPPLFIRIPGRQRWVGIAQDFVKLDEKKPTELQ
jgi:hypothetical protein